MFEFIKPSNYRRNLERKKPPLLQGENDDTHKKAVEAINERLNSGDGNRPLLKKLIKAQVECHNHDQHDPSQYPTMVIEDLKVALIIDQCRNQFPDLGNHLEVVAPLWLAGNIPALTADINIPPRFSQLNQSSMAALFRAAIDRRPPAEGSTDSQKAKKFKQKSKQKTGKPHLLDKVEYIYMAEVLARKIAIDGPIIREFEKKMHYVLNFFFSGVYHPDSSFPRAKRLLVPSSPQKPINEGDILVLLEDFACQTYLALADIDDPRHLSARCVMEALIDIDTKIAKANEQETNPMGDASTVIDNKRVSSNYNDITKAGMTLFLTDQDVARHQLNLVDYLSLLIENSVLTGDPWYENLARDIIFIMHSGDFVVEQNRILVAYDLDRFFNTSYWADLGNQPPALHQTLQEWRASPILSLYFKAQPDALVELNKHMLQLFRCETVEINYDTGLQLVEVILEAKYTFPSHERSPENQAPGHIIYKTSLVIDVSNECDPQVFPDVIDEDEVPKEVSSGLMTMINHIIMTEMDVRRVNENAKKAEAALPPKTHKPIPATSRGPTQTPAKKAKRKHIHQSTFNDSHDREINVTTIRLTNQTAIDRAVAGQVDQFGHPKIKMAIPTDELRIPAILGINQVIQQIQNYNAGKVRAKILRLKAPDGKPFLSLRLGDYRILASIEGPTAKIISVKHRSKAYRNI